MIANLILLALFVFTILLFLQVRNRFMSPKKFNLLSLGDSYTIGEGLPAEKNFPAQLVDYFLRSGYMFAMPDVLAKTGWTAEDLLDAIKKTELKEHYNFVTLLIGVNDQYQGKSIREFEHTFVVLLKIAIRFAGDNPTSVFVLKIPDWGQTPFAEGRDRAAIAAQIAAYNEVNRRITQEYGANFVETNNAKESNELTDDQLHPSAPVYYEWSLAVAHEIQKQMA
jgi:lysophospholipase L1-like esterase